MKLLVIDGSEVFECDTSYIKRDSKNEIEASIKEMVSAIHDKFKEFGEPVLNTFNKTAYENND
jgi:hypothetical protein